MPAESMAHMKMLLYEWLPFVRRMKNVPGPPNSCAGGGAGKRGGRGTRWPNARSRTHHEQRWEPEPHSNGDNVLVDEG